LGSKSPYNESREKDCVISTESVRCLEQNVKYWTIKQTIEKRKWHNLELEAQNAGINLNRAWTGSRE